VELLDHEGEFTTVRLQRAPGRDGIGSSNEGDIDDLETVFRWLAYTLHNQSASHRWHKG